MAHDRATQQLRRKKRGDIARETIVEMHNVRLAAKNAYGKSQSAYGHRDCVLGKPKGSRGADTLRPVWRSNDDPIRSNATLFGNRTQGAVCQQAPIASCRQVGQQFDQADKGSAEADRIFNVEGPDSASREGSS
jgi:hypothetical protein